MRTRLLASTGLFLAVFALSACGKKEAATPAATAPAATTAGEPAAGVATAGAPASGTWTPEALEELAAPIALYPDVVLGHVLAASTNPQEVLDAGNWLIAHQDLTGSALDKEAAKLGFSPSTRALLQFPETVDMMCMQMDWTTQLGQAFTADQGAVLDAVQRLRTQAKDVGNLESSKQLKVETETQEGKEVVTVAPADPRGRLCPEIRPRGRLCATAGDDSAADYDQHHAGAGHDHHDLRRPGRNDHSCTDHHDHDNHRRKGSQHGRAGHDRAARLRCRPPGQRGLRRRRRLGRLLPELRPRRHVLRRGAVLSAAALHVPAAVRRRLLPCRTATTARRTTSTASTTTRSSSTTAATTTGSAMASNSTRVDTRPAKSPITAAKPNRSELNDLNRQASDRARTQAQRPDTRQAQSNQARQTGYAGARPENKAARDKMVQNSPKPAGVSQDLPKRPQGTYAGAKDRPAASQRPAAAKPATREPPKQLPGGATDRGRGGAEAARPSASRPDLARDRPASTPARPEAARERPATQAARAGPAASIIRTAAIWRRGIQCQQREAGACRARGQSARSLQQAQWRQASGAQGGGKRPGR